MFGLIRRARLRKHMIESEKDARIENAERDLRAWQERSDRAVGTLYERHGRNHWRESIERMIQGAN